MIPKRGWGQVAGGSVSVGKITPLVKLLGGCALQRHTNQSDKAEGLKLRGTRPGGAHSPLRGRRVRRQQINKSTQVSQSKKNGNRTIPCDLVAVSQDLL